MNPANQVAKLRVRDALAPPPAEWLPSPEPPPTTKNTTLKSMSFSTCFRPVDNQASHNIDTFSTRCRFVRQKPCPRPFKCSSTIVLFAQSLEAPRVCQTSFALIYLAGAESFRLSQLSTKHFHYCCVYRCTPAEQRTTRQKPGPPNNTPLAKAPPCTPGYPLKKSKI